MLKISSVTHTSLILIIIQFSLVSNMYLSIIYKELNIREIYFFIYEINYYSKTNIINITTQIKTLKKDKYANFNIKNNKYSDKDLNLFKYFKPFFLDVFS